MRRLGIAPTALSLVACLTACVSYIGDITISALAMFLLPTALAVGLVAIRLRDRTLVGLPVVALTAWLGAEVVNLASGDLQGPAARTTAVATACTGLAMLLAGSRAPALFLLPLGGIVAGALAFGAGGHVQVVAIATAGLGALALASIERDRRALVTRKGAGTSLLLALLLVSVAAVFAVLFQGQHDTRTAQAPLRQKYDKVITAPDIVSLRQPAAPKPSAKPTRTAPAATPLAPHHSDHFAQVIRWLLFAVGIFLVLLLLLAGRLILASWSWRRYFRRIDRSNPGTVGAWLWAMAHLQRVGLAPPPANSPDLLAAGRLEGVMEGLQESVQKLAAVVAPSVFGNPRTQTSSCAEESRALSLVLTREAWNLAGTVRRTRGRWMFAPRGAAFRS